jgi:VIT1/CCC1 family predicted Fe2+/Mn2+ transporter
MTDNNTQEQKDIAFHEASVNAWYLSSLERDKSILTLSAGGIGLLITLLTTIGLKSAWALAWYVVAIVAFVVAIIGVLYVFSKNKDYIEKMLNNDSLEKDPLPIADKVVYFSFIIGVVATAIIGIVTAFISVLHIKG